MRKISITETELADLIKIGAKMVLDIKHPEFETTFLGVNRRYHESRRMLEEECHAFEEQYQWARDIAKQCVANLRNGFFSFQVEHRYEAFSNVDVTIILDESVFLCHAEIYRINTNTGTIYINVYYSRNLYSYYKDYQLEDETYRIVVHEMTHGNIFAHRIKYLEVEDDKVDDTPDYYQNIVQAMRYYPVNSDEYLFVRAMYLYYYQEKQAIISQGYAEIDNELRSLNKTTVKNSEIKNLIWRTESYKDFADSKMICNKIIKYPHIRTKIQISLKDYDINMPNRKFLAFVKNIRKSLAAGLKNIVANKYYYCWKNYRIVG